MRQKYFMLGMGILSALSMGAVESPYKGIAPSDIVPGESYYLYNVNFGSWLGDNNRNTDGTWTSHAELGDRGRDIKFISKDGGWQLDPKLGGNHSINGSGLYMDTGSAVTIWHLDNIEGSVSNALRVYADNGQLGVNQNGNTDNNTSDNNVWQVVSAQERWDVAVATATEENPVNVSWAVLGGTFPVADDHRGDNGAWKGDKGSNASGGDGFRHCNRVWELWGITDRDIYQNITVPNGKFLVGGRAIYVSSGNDNVNAERYNNYVNGTDLTPGWIYANEAQARMHNVYEYVTDAKVNDYNTKDLGNGKWAFQGTNEYSTNMFDGKGEVEQVPFTVTDNQVRIGFKVVGGTGISWILVNNIDLWYAGKINDLSAFTTRLEEVIAEAEALNTSETSAAASAAFNEALAAAKDALAAADQTEESLSSATAALNNAIGIVKSVNVNYINRCIAFYTELNPAYTSEALTKARDMAVSAMDGTALQNAADALILDYRHFAAGKSGKPTLYTKPIETTDNQHAQSGKYYLYNVGTGRWFCGGDDWGAHAAVGFPGIELEVVDDKYGEGCYNGIITWLCNGDWGNSHKLNNSGYCDTSGNAWKFWPQTEDGVFTISRNGDDTGNNEGNGFGTRNLLGFANNTYDRVNTDCEGADNADNQWMFVTKEQRDEMLKGATENAPVDATYLIAMPGFNQRERVAGTSQNSEVLPWTCNHANWRYDPADNGSRHIICERGNNHPDFCVDIYDWDEFSLSQEVEVPLEGAYRVKMQGYYRDGGDATNPTPILAAVLKANDQEVEIRSINSEPTLPWHDGRYPDNTWQGIDAFQNGLYWNEVPAVYVTDGKVNIAVEKNSKPNSSDNLMLDNFRLEYLGAYDFAIATESCEHHADKTVTLALTVSHQLAELRGVDHYEVWVVKAAEPTPAGSKAYAPAISDEVVASKDFTPEEFNAGKVNLDINTLPVDQINSVIIRAKAVLADDTSVYSSAMAEGHPEGSTGEQVITIDTSKDNGVTGIESIVTDGIDDASAIYNLHGIRVNNPTAPGIYIRGGKKFVVR